MGQREYYLAKKIKTLQIRNVDGLWRVNDKMRSWRITDLVCERSRWLVESCNRLGGQHNIMRPWIAHQSIPNEIHPWNSMLKFMKRYNSFFSTNLYVKPILLGQIKVFIVIVTSYTWSSYNCMQAGMTAMGIYLTRSLLRLLCLLHSFYYTFFFLFSISYIIYLFISFMWKLVNPSWLGAHKCLRFLVNQGSLTLKMVVVVL